ncbi:MAG TPA: DUF423 domain-containing protein [Flavisolibacter sp.]|jgi:uncharacterized membrane protein YgdD (TMEM256/DUF423 family)|nr:DUF423 domain-containing protein [Flavisolibacter sp.]
MQKMFLIIGTLLAGLAVALGAFGAHGLKKIVDSDTVAIYQTGVQYQMYHALALLFLGLIAERLASTFINYAGLFLIAGIVFFSGSLYLIASLKAINKVIPTAIGIMTPFGGLLFIIGWILLLIALIKK